MDRLSNRKKDNKMIWYCISAFFKCYNITTQNCAFRAFVCFLLVKYALGKDIYHTKDEAIPVTFSGYDNAYFTSKTKQITCYNKIHFKGASLL